MLKHRPMDVALEAERLGFHLVETKLGSEPVWAWQRGIDVRWPHFPNREQAHDWMEDQIRRATLFDR